MSKPGRTWFPLDANFTQDDAVLRAGEPAAYLYLAILGRIKQSAAQGTITRREISRLGLPRSERRLAALLAVGLVFPSPDDADVIVVPAWESWQRDSDRAEYMRKWRARNKPPPGPDQ